MLDAAFRLLGNIVVTEAAGKITIAGIPANTVTADIGKVWATSRINKYMFTKITYARLEFFSFFAVEVLHMLTSLLAAQKVNTNRRSLEHIIDLLKKNTWLRQIDAEHPDILDMGQLDQIRFELLPHQKEFLARYNWVKPRYNLRGILLMVPPGGGKTISDISVAVTSKADVTYIVSPKNAIYNVWQKTLLNDMTNPQRIWISDQDQPFDKEAKWLIFHYEDLDKAIAIAKRDKRDNVTVILDESHGFNDVNSQRTVMFLELCSLVQARNIIWASGTPVKAMGKETIPLIRSIDPLFTPAVEARFKKIFGQSAERGYDILAHRLGLISYKVPKSAFMADKPTITDLPITMPNAERYTLPSLKKIMEAFINERQKFYKARKEEDTRFYHECINIYYRPRPKNREESENFARYEMLVKKFVKYGFDTMSMGDDAKFCNSFERDHIIPQIPKDLRLRFIDVKSVVKYVDLKIRGECLGRILSKEREQCHVDMMQHIPFDKLIDNAKKKTLIFTSYVNVVDEAYKVCSSAGYVPLRVYGDTNSQLTDIIGRFDKEIDVNPLIATYQSLSSAVPLIMANNLIMTNSPFRYHEQEQAISRCNRLGQDTPVTVWRTFLDTGDVPNISTRSEEIFEWSRFQVSQILGIEEPTTTESVALEDVYGGYDECFDDVSYCLLSCDLPVPLEEPVSYVPASMQW